jgi:WD40 repeat protein
VKRISLIFLWCVQGFAAVITPSAILKTDGLISDMVVREGKIYASTDAGVVNVFDLKTRRKLSSLSLPKVQSSSGKIFSPKVYSVDHFAGSTVMVTQSGESFRNLYLWRDNALVKVIGNESGLLIKKVRFVDANHLLFGLSGDTVVLMDVKMRKRLYEVQAGGGVFGDMALSPKRTLVAIGDESGEIVQIDTRSGKVLKTLSGINLDAINRIAYQNDTIISGGHDRRVGVYKPHGSYFIETNFFVYAVGLSPSSSLGVYTDGDENELQLFEIETQKKRERLKGGESLYDTLIFLDEHTLIGSGEENKIYYWRIP